MASRGMFADCNPLKACRRNYGGQETFINHEKSYSEPVFGLSILGDCGNMAVQHGQHSVEENLHLSVDMKGSL